MLDWNNYRSELMQRLGELGKLTPETMSVVALGNAGNKTDLYGRKVRELIALACAVTTRCDGCIAFRRRRWRPVQPTLKLLKLGVAINLNAGAAVIHSAHSGCRRSGTRLTCSNSHVKGHYCPLFMSAIA